MAKYELESSPIWDDVSSVIYSGYKPVKFEYRAQVHTEKQDITVFKVTKIDLLRDYANHIGDHAQIEFQMPLGDYMLRLYPFRNNLELSLKKITLADGSDKKQPNSKIIIKRYKAVFITDAGGTVNPVVSGSDLDRIDYATLNNMDIVTVRLELLDRSLEPLRIKQTFGSYRGATMQQLISSIMASESSKVTVDGKPAVDSVDVVEPDNTETQNNIIIPNGTMLTSIPTFLHERSGGVYTAGIGTYLQTYKGKNTWFVYPLYNTTLFDKSKGDKAIIYALPQDRFAGLDRTYLSDGGIIKILATSAKKYRDSADTNFMNNGSGFRMADARSYMTKPIEITKDGPKAKRTNLNHEVAFESRADGLNFAPVVGGPSSNPYVQYSRILAMRCARVDLTWENSDPDLVYPGMPVKYVFLENDKIVEVKGVIQFVQNYTQLQSQGSGSSIYKNITALVLLVEQVSIENTLKNRTLPEYDGISEF